MRRTAAIRAVPLVALVTFGCKSEKVDRVSLEFRPTDAGLSGFDCPEIPQQLAGGSPGNTFAEYTGRATPPPLANRGLKACGGADSVSFVVDFVRLGAGALRCDVGELNDWCTSHVCAAIPELRRCFARPLDAPPGWGATDALSAALRGLAGELVMQSAPAEYVLVRVVATSDPCDAVADASVPFACGSLLGCATSCAVNLDEYSGALPVILDLGYVDSPASSAPGVGRAEVCARGVRTCARTPFGPQDQCSSAPPRPACDPR